MSLTPERPPGLPLPNSESANAAGTQENPILQKSSSTKLGWQRRLLRISLALFIFEVGVFLVVFPWTENWNVNYLQSLTSSLRGLWYEPSFRGALTGLGFVDIYIACLQVAHSFRRS
jgi:hypothetical protein